MPKVEYSTVVAAPVDRVWDYVEDLRGWCHLMIGYQALEIVDDRRSIWTLRGDVGILTREVRLQIDITEWVPRERVRFVVTGLTERLEGGGAFLMAAADEATTQATAGSATAAPAPVPEGLLRRLRFRIAMAILRRLSRRSTKARAAALVSTADRGTTQPVAGGPVSSSRLVFQLEVRPLGPMAPMLEILMAPMLEPAAKSLADGIREAVES